MLSTVSCWDRERSLDRSMVVHVLRGTSCVPLKSIRFWLHKSIKGNCRSEYRGKKMGLFSVPLNAGRWLELSTLSLLAPSLNFLLATSMVSGPSWVGHACRETINGDEFFCYSRLDIRLWCPNSNNVRLLDHKPEDLWIKWSRLVAPRLSKLDRVVSWESLALRSLRR